MIGDTIKQIRKAKNINQSQFCEKIQINKGHFSQIESGKAKPSLAILEKIAKGLDINLKVLFILSLTKEDIPETKHNEFEMKMPIVKEYLTSFFDTN